MVIVVSWETEPQREQNLFVNRSLHPLNCSDPIPHLPFPSQRELLLGPPFIRIEHNSWDILAVLTLDTLALWTLDVFPLRSRKTMQVVFQILNTVVDKVAMIKSPRSLFCNSPAREFSRLRILFTINTSQPINLPDHMAQDRNVCTEHRAWCPAVFFFGLTQSWPFCVIK